MSDPGAPRGLRLTILDDPFAAIQHPFAAEMFAGMMRARADGYARLYEGTYLPFDRSDFVATHHLLCDTDGERLTPQGGFKEVSLGRCEEYGLRLPILDFCECEDARGHRTALQELAQECRTGGWPLIYGGDIFLRPGARGAVSPDFFKEVSAALTCLRRETQGDFTEVLSATVRTGTDAYFEKIGFRPLQLGGATLPIVPHPASPRDRALLMVMREPSDWAYECYLKHKGFIDDGLQISVDAPAGSEPLNSRRGL